jgi:pimeloyl-ACP methyl ester carboxylesterase
MFLLTRRHLLSLAAGTAATAFVPTAWAAAAPQPISEDGFVRIGGIEQWVAIRGRDRSRPAMLFLHGGPCEAESPFLSLFAPWEERYVVAQWDQRGTGRTFGRSGTPPNMTMEQLTKDAIEVTQYVLNRVQAHKLILVGFSWGRIPLNSTPERAATTYRSLTLSFRVATTLDVPPRPRANSSARCMRQRRILP